MTLVAYDFETEEIKDYPQYPPKPVGISIYEKGGTPHYYAWVTLRVITAQKRRLFKQLASIGTTLSTSLLPGTAPLTA